MTKYETYAIGLGFVNPRQMRFNKAGDMLLLEFTGINHPVTSKVLGRCKRYKPNLFVYVLRKDRAVRVDTARNRLLLANSPQAVKLLTQSVA